MSSLSLDYKENLYEDIEDIDEQQDKEEQEEITPQISKSVVIENIISIKDKITIIETSDIKNLIPRYIFQDVYNEFKVEITEDNKDLIYTLYDYINFKLSDLFKLLQSSTEEELPETTGDYLEKSLKQLNKITQQPITKYDFKSAVIYYFMNIYNTEELLPELVELFTQSIPKFSNGYSIQQDIDSHISKWEEALKLEFSKDMKLFQTISEEEKYETMDITLHKDKISDLEYSDSTLILRGVFTYDNKQYNSFTNTNLPYEIFNKTNTNKDIPTIVYNYNSQKLIKIYNNYHDKTQENIMITTDIHYSEQELARMRQNSITFKIREYRYRKKKNQALKFAEYRNITWNLQNNTLVVKNVNSKMVDEVFNRLQTAFKDVKFERIGRQNFKASFNIKGIDFNQNNFYYDVISRSYYKRFISIRETEKTATEKNMYNYSLIIPGIVKNQPTFSIKPVVIEFVKVSKHHELKLVDKPELTKEGKQPIHHITITVNNVPNEQIGKYIKDKLSVMIISTINNRTSLLNKLKTSLNIKTTQNLEYELPQSKLSLLQKQDPDVFKEPYPTECESKRQPIIIEKSKIKDWTSQTFVKRNTTYNREVMAFPLKTIDTEPEGDNEQEDEQEGSGKTFYLGCDNPDYPFPGVSKSKSRDVYFPCCFEENIKDNPNSDYYKIIRGIPVEHGPKNIVKTSKILNPGSVGILADMTQFFNYVFSNQVNVYRYGVLKDGLEVIHCMCSALNLGNYLDMTNEEKSMFAQEERSKITQAIELGIKTRTFIPNKKIIYPAVYKKTSKGLTPEEVLDVFKNSDKLDVDLCLPILSFYYNLIIYPIHMTKYKNTNKYHIYAPSTVGCYMFDDVHSDNIVFLYRDATRKSLRNNYDLVLFNTKNSEKKYTKESNTAKRAVRIINDSAYEKLFNDKPEDTFINDVVEEIMNVYKTYRAFNEYLGDVYDQNGEHKGVIKSETKGDIKSTSTNKFSSTMASTVELSYNTRSIFNKLLHGENASLKGQMIDNQGNCIGFITNRFTIYCEPYPVLNIPTAKQTYFNANKPLIIMDEIIPTLEKDYVCLVDFDVLDKKLYGITIYINKYTQSTTIQTFLSKASKYYIPTDITKQDIIQSIVDIYITTYKNKVMFVKNTLYTSIITSLINKHKYKFFDYITHEILDNTRHHLKLTSVYVDDDNNKFTEYYNLKKASYYIMNILKFGVISYIRQLTKEEIKEYTQNNYKKYSNDFVKQFIKLDVEEKKYEQKPIEIDDTLAITKSNYTFKNLPSQITSEENIQLYINKWKQYTDFITSNPRTRDNQFVAKSKKMFDKLSNLSEYMFKSLTTHVNDINTLTQDINIGFKHESMFSENIHNDNTHVDTLGINYDKTYNFSMRSNYTNKVFSNINDYLRWTMLYADKKHIAGKIIVLDTLDTIRRYPYCYKIKGNKGKYEYHLIQNNDYSDETKDVELSKVYSYYTAKYFIENKHNVGYLVKNILTEKQIEDIKEEMNETGYIVYKYNSADNKIDKIPFVNKKHPELAIYGIVEYDNGHFAGIIDVDLNV